MSVLREGAIISEEAPLPVAPAAPVVAEPPAGVPQSEPEVVPGAAPTAEPAAWEETRLAKQSAKLKEIAEERDALRTRYEGVSDEDVQFVRQMRQAGYTPAQIAALATAGYQSQMQAQSAGYYPQGTPTAPVYPQPQVTPRAPEPAKAEPDPQAAALAEQVMFLEFNIANGIKKGSALDKQIRRNYKAMSDEYPGVDAGGPDAETLLQMAYAETRGFLSTSAQPAPQPAPAPATPQVVAAVGTATGPAPAVPPPLASMTADERTRWQHQKYDDVRIVRAAPPTLDPDLT